MSARVQVLDHGYLEAIESWGSDESIVEAARMSTAKGFLGWGPRCTKCDHAFPYTDGKICLTLDCGGTERKAGDEKLLGYLWTNRHARARDRGSVFREWHRHRTQSYNEMSARYVPMPDVNYVPSVERLLINARAAAASGNKQAGTIAGAAVLDEAGAGELFAEGRSGARS